MRKFAKTKILATLGPASADKKTMNRLVEAGVDAFRINFSHGDHKTVISTFDLINTVCIENSLPITTVIDLQGPKIRIGEIENDAVTIKRGSSIEITVDEVLGTKELISTSYKKLPRDAKIGDKILIDDGLIHLAITEKKSKSVICKVMEGGVVKPHKGMNLPGMELSTPSITEKDKKDLMFALNFRIDYIALSFVRKAKDILDLKKWLKNIGYKIPIIAKIEKPEAVENMDEIIDVADAIMVARGDLGVELKPEEVPIIQKEIITKCNAIGKPVITATQMFESMITNPVPTRAEASDVANAVWDGTDTVMLSAETSVGKYPVQAVKKMNDILLKTEASKNNFHEVIFPKPDNLIDNVFDANGKAVVDIANQINAKGIVVITHYGRKASVISKHRPEAPVIALSDKFSTLNKLNINSSLFPYYVESLTDEKHCYKKAIAILKNSFRLKKGDVVLFTAGAPITDTERKNWTHSVILE